MTISELIIRLKAEKKIHGDIAVTAMGPDGMTLAEISQIDYMDQQFERPMEPGGRVRMSQTRANIRLMP